MGGLASHFTSTPATGFGKITGSGNVGNSIMSSLVDPANESGFFGKNQGPGAFMDPAGTGGGLFPGVPLSTVGVTPQEGKAMNALGAAIAGGATAGGSSSGGGSSLLSNPGALSTLQSISQPSQSSPMPQAAAPSRPMPQAATPAPAPAPSPQKPVVQSVPSAGGQSNPAIMQYLQMLKAQGGVAA